MTPTGNHGTLQPDNVMAISMKSAADREVGDINMTPMIDVLLVLLVIFIVVQMNAQRAFDLQLPHDTAAEPRSTAPIVLEIESGRVLINTREIAPGGLGSFLKELYANRPDRVLYVKAAPDIPYGDVIRHIDIAREAGVVVVGAVLAER